MPIHRTFIVRGWVEPGATTEPIWRYSVQEIPDGSRLGLASLEEVLRYLRNQAKHTHQP